MQNSAQVLVLLNTTHYFIYKNEFFKFWHRRNKAMKKIKLSKLSNFSFLRNCLFVFVALRPKSTAMVIAGWSVYLTTLFPGQA